MITFPNKLSVWYITRNCPAYRRTYNVSFIRKLHNRNGGNIGRTLLWKKCLFPITGFVLTAGFYHYNTSKQVVSCDTLNITKDKQQLFKLRDIIKRVKDEHGCPGIAISVSVDGEQVWSQGFGFANLETRTRCEPDSVMRIASISKPMTMAIVARLWEDGKLDLDKPITDYVKEWPEKSFNDEKITITTRQLVSHLAGIRHYDRNCGAKNVKTQENEKKLTNTSNKGERTDTKPAPFASEKEDGHNQKQEPNEYHSKRPYASVVAALEMFKHDRLCTQPGTQFLYTSHGWTLLSAVAEGASRKEFPALARQLFRELGLKNTYLDQSAPIIYNRASFYSKNKNGKIQNAAYVDNSYKWAAGGFLSTVTDLVKFGNAMLYSYQGTEPEKPVSAGSDRKGPVLYGSNREKEQLHLRHRGYLKPSTVRMIWSPVNLTKCEWDSDGGAYGMGWGVMPMINKYGFGKQRPFYVSHTGGAIGCSSVLLIMPTNVSQTTQMQVNEGDPSKTVPPRGIVVAVIANMQSINLNPVALEIASLFAQNDK